ncbi:hypothetical protein [Algoriphagus sediminis]|uniref:DUF2178 domain-containing protein n=1 Tax=Algoriphagus sediminis TaxID=3057113 RepID=A0ABT7YAK2_9BACT|nr:hypothetical protein [Algoriphagus sediminis]MDN3203553.1 hypothetical protein [Algoriphagus sediminis]
MKEESILKVPMFSPWWKKLALSIFPITVVLGIALGVIMENFTPDNLGQFIYAGWALGFIILNLCKEEEEDEMIKSFRLQSFQTGFYWTIWGLLAIVLISFFTNGGLDSEWFSPYLVLFLLNLYVYAAFRYQLYQSKNN